jgi:hypothetical protein
VNDGLMVTSCPNADPRDVVGAKLRRAAPGGAQQRQVALHAAGTSSMTMSRMGLGVVELVIGCGTVVAHPKLSCQACESRPSRSHGGEDTDGRARHGRPAAAAGAPSPPSSPW